LIRTLLAIAGFTALAAIAQPSAPQVQRPPHVPTTQFFPQLPPPVNNHIGNLSRSITGAPMLPPVNYPGRRQAPFVPVAGGFYGGGYSGGYYPPAQPPMVVVNQQYVPPAPPAPILVVNPDYRSEAPKPVMTEYSNIRNPYENFQPSAPKVFLLALKDGTLRQAVAFWAEGEKLHYVQPDHKQESLPLASLDREPTRRFNSERGIEIRLPD